MRIPKTQKDLRCFYLCKHLKGNIYNKNKLYKIFLSKDYSNLLFKYLVSYPSQKNIKNRSSVSYYKIRDVYLIEKNKVIKFLLVPKSLYAHYYYRHRINGTNLCLYYDNQPWWKYRHHGLERDWLPEDIEEKNINTNIKDRQKTIKYLEILKKDPYAIF